MQSLEIIFDLDSVSLSCVIDTIQSLDFFSEERVFVSSSSNSFLWKEIDKTTFSDPYFLFKFRSELVTFSNVINKNCRYSSLWFNNNLSIDESIGIATLFCRIPGFVQAHICDHEYDYWQNMDDLDIYKFNKKPLEGLNIISNGLPFPLEVDVVDTSQNIGRVVRKRHYIEYVTHLSWLSPKFFEYSGCTAEQILAADFLKEVTQLDNGVLRVKAFDHAFDSDEGEQKDVQQKLRALLYGAS